MMMMMIQTELSIVKLSSTDTRTLISQDTRQIHTVHLHDILFGITKIEHIAWLYSFNRTCKENIHSRLNASNILTTETVVPVSLWKMFPSANYRCNILVESKNLPIY